MSIKENLEKAAALFGDSHEPKCVVITEESKQEIIGNDFDITKHDFMDSAIDEVQCDGFTIELFDSSQQFTSLNKQDAIAIAKALGVTAEDLK